jgi:NADPH-dependent curcumin reductase CurA
MRGSAVGVIVASKSKEFPVGAYALGSPGWTELAIVKQKHLEKIDVPSNGKVTDALGVLGRFHAYIHDLICGTNKNDRSHWFNSLLRHARHR